MIPLPDERQSVIRQRLDRSGRVLAADLAREFQMSEDTIRRDLRELAAAGLCRRVYGGALSTSPAPARLEERNVQNQARKRALGRTAAALARPGNIILIDVGSTNRHIAAELPEGMDLTVVTNAPSVADALGGRDIDLILIGGRVDPRVGGCIGASALAELKRVRADLCFLGACAASPATGITTVDAEEAVFKRALVTQSERTIVALTNDKLATVAPFSVVPLIEIQDLVVEADAGAAKLEGFDLCGLRLHRAGEVRA